MTPTQARYLAYIKKYVDQHDIAPSEMEMARVMCVMPPSVNQMMKSLEKLGFISRSPGVARSIKILLPHELVPKWKRDGEVEIPEAAKKLPKRSTHASLASKAKLHFNVLKSSSPRNASRSLRSIQSWLASSQESILDDEFHRLGRGLFLTLFGTTRPRVMRFRLLGSDGNFSLFPFGRATRYNRGGSPRSKVRSKTTPISQRFSGWGVKSEKPIF